MKKQVIEFLQNLPVKPSEQFNEMLSWYKKAPSANANILRFMNASGFSKENLETLLYELKQAFDIKPQELKKTQAKVIAMDPPQEPIVPVIEVTATSLNEVFPSAPAPVKTAIKLRERYPFLSAPDCPDELKILVNDKFTAYDQYVAAHNALLKLVEAPEAEPVPMDNEQIFELAKLAVESFELDELIFEEMEYFQKNGKVLGTHPIFEERKLKESIDVMTLADAVKRLSNLKNYTARDSKKLATLKDAKKIEELKAKLTSYEREAKLINAKFPLNG